jgi:soluble lytic murein transglycosylase-like protein
MGPVIRSILVSAVAVAVLAGAAPASAETYQFVGSDGTVHFTNAPSDPRYRRMGVSPSASGTAEGYFRVPRTLEAASSLAAMIRAAAQRHGVSEQLVHAVIRVESGFNVRAVSRKGAQGLMQLMPGTAAILGVRNAFDPMDNIEGGVRHLRGLLDRFGNNLSLALAAYNAGEGAVTTYGGIPPYPETQAYVGRILSLVGATEALAAPIPASTYRYVESDGATVYSNIPPRVSRARR